MTAPPMSLDAVGAFAALAIGVLPARPDVDNDRPADGLATFPDTVLVEF